MEGLDADPVAMGLMGGEGGATGGFVGRIGEDRVPECGRRGFGGDADGPAFGAALEECVGGGSAEAGAAVTSGKGRKCRHLRGKEAAVQANQADQRFASHELSFI